MQMARINSTYFVYLVSFFMLVTFLACQRKGSFENPAGYDFTKPEKFILPPALDEISGIALLNDSSNRFYAVNDEHGRIYYFNLTDKAYPFSKFWKKGDYEDLAILNNSSVAVLKSDGSLYLFATDAVGTKEIKEVNMLSQLLPKGEYEGMAAEANRIYVLCKYCQEDKKGGQLTVYAIEITEGQEPKIINPQIVELSSIKKKKLKFRPSCIAKNPVTHEWYIISSLNKLLVVLDTTWVLKAHYPLDPAIFRQPEGMAFNAKGDLYISNEGRGGAANILLFRYQGQ